MYHEVPTPIQFDRAVLRAELPRSDKAARRWPLIDSDPHADQPRQLDSRHACLNSEVDNLAALNVTAGLWQFSVAIWIIIYAILAS